MKLPSNSPTLVEYIRDIIRALLTFKYHVVFNMVTGLVTNINPIYDEDKPLIALFDNAFYGQVEMEADKALTAASGSSDQNSLVRQMIQ